MTLVQNETQRHSAVLKSAVQSPIGLLQLNDLHVSLVASDFIVSRAPAPPRRAKLLTKGGVICQQSALLVGGVTRYRRDIGQVAQRREGARLRFHRLPACAQSHQHAQTPQQG